MSMATPGDKSGSTPTGTTTPASEASMATATLSSVSYWMTQIRLAEAASRHSLSLDFFNLAVVAKCEPLDQMKEELKAYVALHGLAAACPDAVDEALRRYDAATLSSVSYWMTHIRLAESASKHSISLVFFKLALESEREPLDRTREELKAYVARHGLATEFENPVKDILQVYDIAEDFEKLEVSSESSQETNNSDNAALSAANVTSNANLDPISREAWDYFAPDSFSS